MTATSIDLSVVLEASPEQSWEFLTVPRHLAAWFGPHMSLEARPGGRMEERWEQDGREMVTSGLVDAFEPPRLLSMTWADSDWPAATRVTIQLHGHGTHTQLVLTHTGWDSLPQASHDGLRKAHEAGWAAHLQSLVRYAARSRAAPGPHA